MTPVIFTSDSDDGIGPIGRPDDAALDRVTDALVELLVRAFDTAAIPAPAAVELRAYARRYVAEWLTTVGNDIVHALAHGTIPTRGSRPPILTIDGVEVPARAPLIDPRYDRWLTSGQRWAGPTPGTLSPAERSREREQWVYDRDRFPCTGRVRVDVPSLLARIERWPAEWHPCKVLGVVREGSSGRPTHYRVSPPDGMLSLDLPRNRRAKHRPRAVDAGRWALVRASAVQLDPKPERTE